MKKILLLIISILINLVAFIALCVARGEAKMRGIKTMNLSPDERTVYIGSQMAVTKNDESATIYKFSNNNTDVCVYSISRDKISITEGGENILFVAGGENKRPRYFHKHKSGIIQQFH